MSDINPQGRCQYCRGPVQDSYTCADCTAGWPTEYCRCENNGDYCAACEAWIEFRRQKVALGRTPHAHENPFINERYRYELLQDFEAEREGQ